MMRLEEVREMRNVDASASLQKDYKWTQLRPEIVLALHLIGLLCWPWRCLLHWFFDELVYRAMMLAGLRVVEVEVEVMVSVLVVEIAVKCDQQTQNAK